MKKKKIYLFRNHFPKEIGETFLDIELKYATTNIEVFVINPVPTNAVFHRDYKLNKINFKLHSKKSDIIYIFFKKIFWEELINILRNYKEREIFSKIRELMYLLYLSNAAQRHLYMKIIKEKNKKIILYSYWLTLSAYIICELKKKIKTKEIITISRTHRYDLYFDYPFKKYLAKNVDYICFISEHGRRYLSKRFKIRDRDRLKLFYLGSEKGMYGKYKKKERIRIVSCSHIVPVKRLELLIKSLSNINNIKIEWIHIGEGKETEYERKIKEYAKEKLLNKENIEYRFNGFMKNEEVIKYYEENYIDLFINTSESEGLPVSMMEAMSFGVPVIGPDINGVPEIIRDRENGYLFKVNAKPSEISQRIKEYIKLKDEEKEKMKWEAYKTWEEKFNAEKNYKKFYEFLNGL